MQLNSTGHLSSEDYGASILAEPPDELNARVEDRMKQMIGSIGF